MCRRSDQVLVLVATHFAFCVFAVLSQADLLASPPKEDPRAQSARSVFGTRRADPRAVSAP